MLQFAFRGFTLLLAFLVCVPAFPQGNQATISGVVTDAQGAAIPGASVTAVDSATAARFPVKTNDSGFYSIPNLPVGAYSITVEHEGFRRNVRENLTLSTGQVLGLDARLELGAVTETVNVSAEAPLVESRTSGISQLIEAKSISDIPLGDRRTMNAIALSGAAVFNGYDAGQKPNFSLAGGRTQSQMFWIDGGTGQNMRMGIGQMDLDPPVDAVEEIKVLSNNYSAEYGGSAGGVIVETTKSGTNRFHGSLFEYFRNNVLDAPGFFAPIVNGKKVTPELRSNIYGGTIGGPIKRNKTFFFFAYQGRPRRNGAVDTVIAPTALQRGGDFSQTLSGGKLVPIYDPTSTTTVNGVTTRTQFPGNIIPASRFDAAGAKAIQYYPFPNTGVNTAQGNFVTGINAKFYEAKVDHNFSDTDKLTGRYIYDNEDTDTTSIYPNPAADPRAFLPAHEHVYHAAWTHIFGPTKVNDLRGEYSTRFSHSETHGLGQDYAGKLGIPNLPANAFPNFAPAGYASLGSTAQERRQFPILQSEIVDNYSWVIGKHALKFGFEMDRAVNHEINLATASGQFGFSTQTTGLPGNAATGNSLASLLLGIPNSFAENQTAVLNRVMWYLAAFVQDDWTVNRRLTLNLGLRWETDTPMSDTNNRFNGFDPHQINPVSGTPGVVKFLGLNGYRTTAYNADLNNVGPRLGFAWKPFDSENTVIRGGFGIFFAHPFDAGVPNQAVLGFSTSIAVNSPDNGLTFPFTLSQGPPAFTSAPLNDSFGAVPVGKSTT
ncbi:MAG: carboxypeptidase regulatory-like domain-containing protein, partial [Acidobacteriota bacterium]|nr:carboxypeptidase regulatory-like domain-containing protein [Acidobacteriota bacterium]